MRTVAILAGILGLTGCIENDIRSNIPPVGVANARPLPVKSTTDKLVQTPVPVVDILWIIDNSTSMLNEQQALTANFPVFMDYFLGSGLDYHIGVISTDFAVRDGQLEYSQGAKWVDPDTEDPIALFSDLAGLGTRIGTDERGRDPAYKALDWHDRPGGFNEGFERDDGGLHLVVISDEDDHSDIITVAEFAEFLEGSRPDPEDVTFSGITTPPQNCSPGGAEPGLDYHELTNLVGGYMHSICNDDWVTVLEQLGAQAAGLRREYFLSDLPVPGTIEVWVVDGGTTHTFDQDVDWIYNDARNSIVFVEFVPSAFAEVFIEYELLSATEGGA